MGDTMARTNDPTPSNPLAALLVEALRTNRQLQLEIALTEEVAAGRLEALTAALATLADRDRELTRGRASLRALLDENRALIAAQSRRCA